MGSADQITIDYCVTLSCLESITNSVFNLSHVQTLAKTKCATARLTVVMSNKFQIHQAMYYETTMMVYARSSHTSPQPPRLFRATTHYHLKNKNQAQATFFTDAHLGAPWVLDGDSLATGFRKHHVDGFSTRRNRRVAANPTGFCRRRCDRCESTYTRQAKPKS